MEYRGRTVIVTGSSRGIGKNLCEYFLKKGANVCGLSRSTAAITHTRYLHFPADVTDEEAVRTGVARVKSHFGSIDVLINNAGVLTSQYSLIMPLRSAETMFRTNVLGAFVAARECTKVMIPQRFGRIIAISSMAVPLSPAGDALYSASKSALTQFSRVFAKEVARYNITCNVLGVTAIETDMTKQIPEKALTEILQRLPIPRLATMDDITNVIDFFASELSSNVTAQTLYLGGLF